MINKRHIGNENEIKAVEHLKKAGYKILERNYYCPIGEIDIIARKNEYLIFVEVKYRISDKRGTPGEAIDYRKQKRICKVADYYLLTHGYTMDTSCRFDVVLILQNDVSIIENAFDYTG